MRCNPCQQLVNAPAMLFQLSKPVHPPIHRGKEHQQRGFTRKRNCLAPMIHSQYGRSAPSVGPALALLFVLSMNAMAQKRFQVDTNGTLTTGLAAYYKLEDANDFWGSNNLFSLGTVSYDAGKVGNSADFGTSNSGNGLHTLSNLGITSGSRSISAWVKPNAQPSNQDFVFTGLTNSIENVNFELVYRDQSGSKSVLVQYDKNFVQYVLAGGAFTMTTGTWYHIVGTFDGSQIELFVNGVSQGTASVSGTGNFGDKNDFSIGYLSHSEGNFAWSSANVDEVGVWSKKLSGQEIADLYNQGNGQTMIPNSACASIVDHAVNVSLGGYGAIGNVFNPTEISATFTPQFGLSLAQAAAICGVIDFDWQQTITSIPDPSPFYTFTGQHLTSASTPWLDPPPDGGYSYCQVGRLVFCDGYPFYYNPARLSTGCAKFIFAGICGTDIVTGNTLNYFDAPTDPLLPPGTAEFFRTQLVGVSSNGNAVPLGGAWTWSGSFNGTSGGIAQTLSYTPVDPGSGTGGITITNINGVPQTAPSVSCTASPTTLWPPNSKPVLVTVSGTITAGTQTIPSGGTAYTVIDKYGQVQPSGAIPLGTGGSYSFGVSLIAARNGEDPDGRTYTIIVIGRDEIGNVTSCSALVTVPHDQGHQ